MTTERGASKASTVSTVLGAWLAAVSQRERRGEDAEHPSCAARCVQHVRSGGTSGVCARMRDVGVLVCVYVCAFLSARACCVVLGERAGEGGDGGTLAEVGTTFTRLVPKPL